MTRKTIFALYEQPLAQSNALCLPSELPYYTVHTGTARTTGIARSLYLSRICSSPDPPEGRRMTFLLAHCIPSFCVAKTVNPARERIRTF
jgi:hypothetical protein